MALVSKIREHFPIKIIATTEVQHCVTGLFRIYRTREEPLPTQLPECERFLSVTWIRTCSYIHGVGAPGTRGRARTELYFQCHMQDVNE